MHQRLKGNVMVTEFDWDDEIECQFTGEILKDDRLFRSEQAAYLTDFLSRYKSDSYVLNLNSQWGTGKTYFLKRWANSIKDKHPAIYFDAWSNDFHNDPLTLILSELISQLKLLLQGESSDNKELVDSLLTKAGKVVKATAPEVVKGAIKALIRVDVDDVAERIEATQQEDMVANAFSSATKKVLDLHKNQQESIGELKEVIGDTLNQVICRDNSDGKKRWSPMYVFIDELDRCRPTFAIELLEVIKHIFSMEKVVFVIATDTSQLQHSIRAVYGAGFNSEKYLERFFDKSFTLTEPELARFLWSMPSVNFIRDRIIKTNDLYLIEWKGKNVIDLMAGLFEGLGIDLRSVLQILDRVVGTLVHHEEENGVIWLLFLETIRVFNKNSFDALVSGRVVNSGDNNAHKYFYNQLREMSKSTELMSKNIVSVEVHSQFNQSGLDKISELSGGALITRARKIKYKDYNVSAVISMFVDFYSKVSAYDYKTKDDLSIFLLYMWKTKGDLRRFHKYVEVASRLK